MRAALIARIREAKAALLEGKDPEKLTDDELLGLAREAWTPPAPKAEAKTADPPADPEWKRELALRDTTARVSEALTGSALPDLAKERIKARFVGRVAEAAEVQAAVREEAEYLAKLSPSGDPRGVGAAAVVIAAPLDKAQAALDRLFGVEKTSFDRAMENAPFLNPDTLARVRESLKPSYDAAKDPGLKFRSLRHAYVQLTGDEDVSGLMSRGRVSEAIESSTWANILGNTLYRRLLMDYAEPQYNERVIASYGSAVDFRNKEVVILDYFPDIATVDPESADYVEITAPSDAKVTYAVIQKGNLLTITRKTIINDDLRAVSQLVGRLGRAFRRTLAKFVWNFWIANSTYDVDSTAWFYARTTSNTGSTALSADAAGAAEVLAKVVQLAEMTEQGSGEKLGMPPLTSLWLDVPQALFGVARRLNLADRFSTTETNPVQYFFGQNGERINCNPLFTDTTDWGVHIAPGVSGRESIQVDFLQGREEPEFFLADQPTVGQMFVGDRIQYKGRLEYGGDILDYRGACKNVVSGG